MLLRKENPTATHAHSYMYTHLNISMFHVECTQVCPRHHILQVKKTKCGEREQWLLLAVKIDMASCSLLPRHTDKARCQVQRFAIKQN